MRQPLHRKAPNENKTGALSTYTLFLPRGEWHAVKSLTTIRRLTLRELVRQTLAEEVARAQEAGEFRNVLGKP